MSDTVLLSSIRKILNETRQDRVCRPLLQEQPVIPYLGGIAPAYLFLGGNPVGYETEGVPEGADDYIHYASSYFMRNDTDKGPFAHHLPFTRNTNSDYETFGEFAMVTNLAPIPTARSSDMTLPVLESCWPRTVTLLRAVKPRFVFIHGTLAWRFMALGDGSPLVDAPASHRLPLQDVFKQVAGADLPFQSRIDSESPDWKPVVMALPHLGRSAPAKALREQAKLGLNTARRLARVSPGTSESTGETGKVRIRVRRPER